MIRYIANAAFKFFVGGLIVYGGFKTYSHFHSRYEGHVKAESQTPVVDTIEDGVSLTGRLMQDSGKQIQKSGEFVSDKSPGYIEYLRQYCKKKSDENNER